jgi:hypothetical protein
MNGVEAEGFDFPGDRRSVMASIAPLPNRDMNSRTLATL